MPSGKASMESHQCIIITTHFDAAYEMTFFRKLPAWAVALHIILPDTRLGIRFVSRILNSVGLTPAVYNTVIGIAMIPVFCSLIGWLFFINWKVISPGASDDLSGCSVAASLLKEMQEKGIRLQYTDVGVLIADGEESGMRVAMAWAKAHR